MLVRCGEQMNIRAVIAQPPIDDAVPAIQIIFDCEMRRVIRIRLTGIEAETVWRHD